MDEWNHFNYFTEIEEYFWKKRGAHLLVSPLDWAIMEAWQKAGVPLEAVLKGIDRACESYQRSRRGAGKVLKSLAYCTDAVQEAAEEQKEAAAGATPKNGPAAAKEAFSHEDLKAYFARNREALREFVKKAKSARPALSAIVGELVDSLASATTLLDSPGNVDLEGLERRLTVLDDKIYAQLLGHTEEELLLKLRREMDAQLAAYRRKMKAE